MQGHDAENTKTYVSDHWNSEDDLAERKGFDRATKSILLAREEARLDRNSGAKPQKREYVLKVAEEEYRRLKEIQPVFRRARAHRLECVQDFAGQGLKGGGRAAFGRVAYRAFLAKTM